MFCGLRFPSLSSKMFCLGSGVSGRIPSSADRPSRVEFLGSDGLFLGPEMWAACWLFKELPTLSALICQGGFLLAKLWSYFLTSSTNQLLSPASASPVKSQRVSVFSRDEKKDSQNQFIRRLRIVISQNKNQLKTGEKVEEMGLWEKVTEHPSSRLFWLFPFFAHFHTRFSLLKDTLWQAL